MPLSGVRPSGYLQGLRPQPRPAVFNGGGLPKLLGRILAPLRLGGLPHLKSP